MAKSNGLLKIEGTVENLTFYQRNGQEFVRRKGGVSKERIMNDPNFVRTRENMSEFSSVANSGKLLRKALGSMLFKAKDDLVISRLQRVLNEVKRLDSVSARGSRTVSEGITTVAGKNLLQGFDFNRHAPFSTVFNGSMTLNVSTGVVSVTGLIPLEQINYPEGATGVNFQSAILGIDFSNGDYDLVASPVETFALDMTSRTFALTPASVPSGAQLFFLLLITFHQEVNGNAYSLKNQEYNVLHVLQIV